MGSLLLAFLRVCAPRPVADMGRCGTLIASPRSLVEARLRMDTLAPMTGKVFIGNATGIENKKF
jgi:hypothetical protein